MLDSQSWLVSRHTLHAQLGMGQPLTCTRVSKLVMQFMFGCVIEAWLGLQPSCQEALWCGRAPLVLYLLCILPWQVVWYLITVFLFTSPIVSLVMHRYESCENNAKKHATIERQCRGVNLTTLHHWVSDAARIFLNHGKPALQDEYLLVSVSIAICHCHL